MSLRRKWYSISSITWIVMILLLVGAYYWLRPNYNLFYIVAGVFMALLIIIWFLTRRSIIRGDEAVDNFLSKYHEDVLDKRDEIDTSEESKNENPSKETAYQK